MSIFQILQGISSYWSQPSIVLLHRLLLHQQKHTYTHPHTHTLVYKHTHAHMYTLHGTKKPVTTMLTYPWKCTVLHCNHLGNTWKPLVLMTRHFDYCPSASEGDNQSVGSSAPVVSRCFPGGYNVKLYISRGRLAWWLLAFLHSVLWYWLSQKHSHVNYIVAGYTPYSLRNIPDWPRSVRLSNITRCWLDTSQSGWDVPQTAYETALGVCLYLRTRLLPILFRIPHSRRE